MDSDHSEEIEREIQSTNDRFAGAFNSAAIEQVAEFYTDDAALLPPGFSVVNGRVAIATFWQSLFAGGWRDLSLRTGSVRRVGEAVYEIGRGRMMCPSEKSGFIPILTKYLVVWRRSESGRWRMQADIWNEDGSAEEGVGAE